MARTNLKPNGAYEQAIYDYLEENASDVLVNVINASNKTLGGCMGFIKGEAQKEAKNGCAMIEDKVVFGWAVHFFEEESIKEGAKPEYIVAKDHTTPAKKVEKKEAKKPEKEEVQLDGQMDIFAFIN